MLARLTTNLLLPEVLFNAAKFLKNGNLTLSERPIIFESGAGPNEVLIPASKLKFLSQEMVRTMDNSVGMHMLYVIVLESGKKTLRIVEQEQFFYHKKTATTPFISSDFIAHSDLAQGLSVLAAGEMRVKNGQIILLNDASGHYMPHGSHVKPLVEDVFCEAGYPEARGKYIDENTAGWNEIRDPRFPKGFPHPATFFGSPTANATANSAVIYEVRSTAPSPNNSNN